MAAWSDRRQTAGAEGAGYAVAAGELLFGECCPVAWGQDEDGIRWVDVMGRLF